jgi:signal transduction histidine kinase
MLLIGLYALIAGAVVGSAGMAVLRLSRRRSILVHILVLLAVTVLAAAAGVATVAQAMFLSGHDLRVVLVTVAASTVVSLLVGTIFGRRLAASAVWARQARQDERRLEASRRELVAWVSHDLRTPLAGLRAMAEALEDGIVCDPATVAEYHHRIRGEAERMAHLVDDLFELSRINAGTLRIQPTAVPLREVVSDAVAAITPLAANRNITLVAADTGWPRVRAGERELARVISNLLINSIHYTPADGTVHIDAGREHDHVWLAVSDSCGGIPDADLPRVFDVAFRGETSRTPGTAGGGLGLAIVRGLVEAYGGRVNVCNTADGCRFEVRLPAA